MYEPGGVGGGMKTVFTKVNDFWVALECDDKPRSNSLEIALGALLLSFMITAILLSI